MQESFVVAPYLKHFKLVWSHHYSHKDYDIFFYTPIAAEIPGRLSFNSKVNMTGPEIREYSGLRTGAIERCFF